MVCLSSALEGAEGEKDPVSRCKHLLAFALGLTFSSNSGCACLFALQPVRQACMCAPDRLWPWLSMSS